MTVSAQRQIPISPNRKIFGGLIALITWSGLIIQLYIAIISSLALGKSVPAAIVFYLSFFTILTNGLVALSLTFPLLFRNNPLSRFLSDPRMLSCILASISLVGLCYHFLLRNLWSPQGIHRIADIILHYGSPILFCLYWVTCVPKSALKWRDPLQWAAYPILYFIYTMVRGYWLGYPYPFINLRVIGWTQLTINSAAALGVFLALSWAIIAIGRLLDRSMGMRDS
jgi:hypothetical protein